MLALSTGCTVSVTGPSASTSAASTSAASTSAAPAGTPSGVPAGARTLDSLVTAATRPAVRTDATVLGDGGSYANALSLWAGCDGSVDEVTLAVSGARLLQGRLALRASAPTSIVAEVLILVDGEPVQNVRLDAGHPVPAFVPTVLVLTGKTNVTTRTKVVQGECTEADQSYVVWVDGHVE